MLYEVITHKTGIAAEQLLIRVLTRAKELLVDGAVLQTSKPLQYFLENNITLNDFDDEVLEIFSELDDFDIISCLKSWQHHDDFVLSRLCQMILNRDLLKIKLKNKKIKTESFNSFIEDISYNFV